MVGLLFARPETPFVASEIMPSFHYYHLRSGKHINFYCSGFLPNWDLSPNPDLYSNHAFEQFRFEIEGRSTWRYSGGADLLLTNARFNGRIAWLDFSSAISADLIKMKADGAIHSVDSFFEAIFRYSQNQDGSDPTWGFSDQQGKRVAGSAFKSLLVSLLPRVCKMMRDVHFILRSRMCHASRLTHRERERLRIVAIARAVRGKQIDAHRQEQGRVIDGMVGREVGIDERPARNRVRVFQNAAAINQRFVALSCFRRDVPPGPAESSAFRPSA